jgi:hypothetical protein
MIEQTLNGLKPVPLEIKLSYLRQTADKIQLLENDEFREPKSRILDDYFTFLHSAKASHTIQKVTSLDLGRDGYMVVSREMIEDENGNNLASLLYLRIAKEILQIVQVRSKTIIEGVVIGSSFENSATIGESDIDILTNIKCLTRLKNDFTDNLNQIVMLFRKDFYRFMPRPEPPIHWGFHLDPLNPESRAKVKGISLDLVPDSMAEMLEKNYLKSLELQYISATEQILG